MSALVVLSQRVIRDRAGATAIEYAMLAAIIAIAIVGAAVAIGTEVSGVFVEVADGFPESE